MRTALLLQLSAFLTLAMMTGPGRADAFSARFSWAGIEACKRVSPEFQLTGVPAGTKRLRFEMHDLNVPAFHHGGSTVAYSGTTVKQGAIRYIGPCPPGGEHHRYRWDVQALDAAGTVLGTANATATFPP